MRSVIVDRCADENVFFALEALGFNVIKSFDIDYIYKPVNTHPDLQIFFADSKTAITAPAAFEYYKSRLPKDISLISGAENPGAKYPEDCAYNAARIGKSLVGNLKFIDREIIGVYAKKNFDFIDVKQGYTKCNLCIISENAAITEDEGLFCALTARGADVLKIDRGEVALDGFDYGFIGGASGATEKAVVFSGDISQHSQYNRIKNFSDKHKVNIISLLQTKLHDYGSLIFF